MPDDPRYEIEDHEIKAALRKLATIIDGILSDETHGRKLGFALQIFEFDGPAFFWISNADRKDMRKALAEFLAREGGH
jgi:hypothetical protein